MRRVVVTGVILGIIALIVWLGQESDNEVQSGPLPVASTTESETTRVPPEPPEFAVAPLEIEGMDGAAAGDASTPAAAAVTNAAPLQVTVVHSDGTPAAGATVVAATGDVVIGTQITGEDGAAQFPSMDGRLELYVGGATWKPQRFEIEPSSGEHRLELLAGAFVGGLVLLDGQPPVDAIGLVLSSNDGNPVFDAPLQVRRALETVSTFWVQEIGQHTTQGRFLFSGIPADWAGSVGFPPYFRVEGGDTYGSLRLEQPARDLIVRLTWDGVVIGRLLLPPVGSDAPEPATAARVEYDFAFEDKSSRSGAFEATEDGRFAIPIHSNAGGQLQLQFRAADGRARESRKLDDLDPHALRDLGDVVLETTQRAEFLVLDEAGLPIEGAVATSLDETHARSLPTGVSGRGMLPDIVPGTTAVRFDALGYEPVELPLSDDMVARLPPAPLLEIRLVDAGGGAPGTMVVRLHCPDVLFDCDDCEGIDPLQVELGATSFFESGVESGPQFQDFKGKAWARGLCLFTRIRSGVPFTVTMLDLYGGELRPPEDIVLEPREQRRVEWRIDSTARTVDVRALTAGGAPVPGAKIYIHSATPGLTEMDWQDLSTHTTVGETGEARFANVFAPKISLQAQCKGYGTAWLVDQFVPPEGATFEFRLEKGRSIDVEVVDADGTARDVNRVALDQAARPVWAQHVAVGHYRIDDAPTGRVVLRADLVGRSYRVTHDTARPTARIEVPPLGSLSARWTIPLTAGQSYTLLVRGTGADGWSTYAWISDEARVSGGPSTIADIVPGDYEVLLRQGPGWTGENPPVSQAVRATVKAGEVTAVVLEP